MTTKDLSHKFGGRGTNQNPAGRFEKIEYVPEPDDDRENDTRPATEFFIDTSKSIISYNESTDIYWDASLNPYRGCEHGCAYCYARPSHEYLDLSAGLDFETKIFIKPDAPKLLRETLSSKKWKPQIIILSGNSDCYQPVEKKLKLTRGCLEVLYEFRNPVHIVTKNKLVTRDIDILSKMAEKNLTAVFFSITTLNNRLASVLEPQTTKPKLKLKAITELTEAGIPTGVLVAPVIPGLTDSEIPEILKSAKEAGAKHAGIIMLRLPYGVKDLFLNWLAEYFPDRQQKVINRLNDLFGGKLYDSNFDVRRKGKGPYAEQINDIFKLSCKKLGINKEQPELSTAYFTNPNKKQMDLFD